MMWSVLSSMEKTCRDCIHHEICVLLLQNTDAVCNGFADKSRYVELPCKVGDTVYCVDYAGEIKPRTVEAFEILEGEIGICDSSHMPCYLCTTKETEKIGSCASNIFYAGVFYTKEKAESALKKQLEEDEKQQSVLKKVFFMKETET